jgi:DhnA family fructose-bisphosphate aldolase class Ia
VTSSVGASGLARRLARIVDPHGPTFMLPIDDALISGVSGALIAPDMLVSAAVDGNATSILGFPGALRVCPPALPVGLVQNLTASTVLMDHTRKVLVGSVSDAVANGADGVAVHVNVSAEAEQIMVATLGAVAVECRTMGMPLFALAYPRRSGQMGDDNYLQLREQEPIEYARLVAHCARIAVELGADVVKVPWPGSASLLTQVVDATFGTPVLVAGGTRTTDAEAWQIAADSVTAGACGVAFGRHTFMRPVEDVSLFVEKTLTAMRVAAGR